MACFADKAWHCIDYDGCGDILKTFTGQKEMYETWVAPVREVLIKHIQTHSGGNCTLACGSLRQDTVSNFENMRKNNNGCAYTVLDQTAEKLGFSVYRGLLGDGDDADSEGKTWENAKKGLIESPLSYTDGDIQMKLDIVDKQMEKCLKEYGPGSSFHFYDDRDDVLKAIAKSDLSDKHGLVLFVWEWDWTKRLNEVLEKARKEENYDIISEPVQIN